MRGHAGVFARQDAAQVGHILPEQRNVLEIERVLGEVNLRFRAWRAVFRRAAAAALVFVGIRLAWHKLFYFLVQSVPAEKRIELVKLQFLRLQFLVAGGRVAGRRLALLACFTAFNGDDFACHKLFLFFNDFFFRLFVVVPYKSGSERGILFIICNFPQWNTYKN